MKPEEVIKNKIESNGVKQSFVADRSNISRDKLSRSLNGKRRLRSDELISICVTLGISVEEFNHAS